MRQLCRLGYWTLSHHCIVHRVSEKSGILSDTHHQYYSHRTDPYLIYHFLDTMSYWRSTNIMWMQWSWENLARKMPLTLAFQRITIQHTGSYHSLHLSNAWPSMGCSEKVTSFIQWGFCSRYLHSYSVEQNILQATVIHSRMMSGNCLTLVVRSSSCCCSVKSKWNSL